MKNKNPMLKNSIIIAAILAVLIAGIYFLNAYTPDSEEVTPTATQTPSYTVYKADSSNVEEFTVVTGEQSLHVKNAGDNKWDINNIPYDELDKSKIESLITSVFTMVSNYEIEQNVSELSQYGLDRPYVTITVKMKDGTADTLFIGEKSPTLGEYFLLKQGDTTVYTIYEYKVNTIINPISYYQTFNRFNVDVNDITSVTLERQNQNTLQMRLKNDVGNEQGYRIVWEIVQPFAGTFNGIDQFINDKILTPISELSISEPAPEGIDYGFDRPSGKIVLKVEPYNESDGSRGSASEVTVLLGNSENNKTYVKFNDNVYAVLSANLDFVFVDEFLAVSKLQALVDIQTTNQVKVTANGVTVQIDITHETDNQFSFTVNGQAADEKQSKQIYQSIISLDVDALYKDEPLAASAAVIQFKGYNGSEDVTIEFCPVNELSYALVRNGQTHFTIKKSKVDTVIAGVVQYAQNPAGTAA